MTTREDFNVAMGAICGRLATHCPEGSYKLIESVNMFVAAQDARIAELEKDKNKLAKQVNDLKSSNESCRAQLNNSLNREVQYMRYLKVAERARDALRFRIESAPVVFVAWHPEHGYSWDDVDTKMPDMYSLTIEVPDWLCAGWGYKKVHAIPVEGKEQL